MAEIRQALIIRSTSFLITFSKEYFSIQVMDIVWHCSEFWLFLTFQKNLDLNNQSSGGGATDRVNLKASTGRIWMMYLQLT
jgi:hypothetical protein